MSKQSIDRMLDAQGTFPDLDVVRANFEILFAWARDACESVEDLADGFSFALDQWAHHGALDAATADRLRAWALSQWRIDSHDRVQKLCAILVNVRSSEVLAFLQAQRELSAEPVYQSRIDRTVAEISRLLAQ